MSRAVAVATVAAAALAFATWTGAGGAEALKDPNALKEEAPPTFRAKFQTSKGDFVITVVRDWAPVGADRFWSLVRHGFFDDTRFFRAVPNFVVQFGMSGIPERSKVWQVALLKDDPVVMSNTRGMVSYAKTAQPHSRTTQVFINLKANPQLDGMGFAPFGEVTSGMEVVDGLYSGYGDGPPSMQGWIAKRGNAYLDAEYPRLDRILKATILEDAPGEAQRKKQKD